jgi:hypothetical protein
MDAIIHVTSSTDGMRIKIPIVFDVNDVLNI